MDTCCNEVPTAALHLQQSVSAREKKAPLTLRKLIDWEKRSLFVPISPAENIEVLKTPSAMAVCVQDRRLPRKPVRFSRCNTDSWWISRLGGRKILNETLAELIAKGAPPQSLGGHGCWFGIVYHGEAFFHGHYVFPKCFQCIQDAKESKLKDS